MIRSDSNFETEFRISPKLVCITLVVLGAFLAFVGDSGVAWSERLLIFEFSLFVFLTAGLSWYLESWRPLVGRWFIIIGLIYLIWLGYSWLGAPQFLALLTAPTALAAALIGLRAAAITTIGETILLLLTLQYTSSTSTTILAIVVVIAIWAVFGVIFTLYQASYDMANWSLEHYQQARRLLDEMRDQKVELKQTQDDLMLANRELVLLTEKLTTMRLVAEEAQKAKAAFVAKISHEFRTPLNMIIGLIDTLTETPAVYGNDLPPALLRDLEIVHRNSEHLASMINDVLALSQAEASQLTLHREWVDLSVDINNAVTVVKPLLEKKNLALQLSIPEALPQIYCDRTRVRQVILNLVSNAARYTQEGSITVTAEQKASHIVIGVTDTGPGISPEHVKRIFEPFQQGPRAFWQDQDGSGLGLSISKQFIEYHDGEIWVESELGVGSTFAFKLPISPLSSPAAGPTRWINEGWVFFERTTWPKVPQLPYKYRIVLCDETDHIHSRLTQYTDEIEFVNTLNLTQAIEELHRCPAHALILNAPSTTRLDPLIARASQTVPDIPVIGCCIPPPINRALEAGAVDYLIKPVTQADLRDAIKTLEIPVKRILIVDDNPDIRQLYTRMLLILDDTLEVFTASTGREALDELRRNPVELVLMDIVLPDMDGWQILELKQQDEALKDVPIIAVSAEDVADTTTKSAPLLATMGQGLSLNQLLQFSVQFSKFLVEPDRDLI